MSTNKKSSHAIRIKVDDQVKVISGDDKGFAGKVLKVLPEDDRVVVEGINFHTIHQKPERQGDQGEIIENELPIHVSNVMLECPNCGAYTRIGMRRLDTGRKVRVCKKCKEMVDQ